MSPNTTSGINNSNSTIKGTDEFTSGVGEFFDALAKRWQAFVAIVVLLLIAGAVTVFVMNKKEEKVDQGRNALFLAQKSIDEQMKKMAEASVSSTKTDAKDAKKSPAADLDAVAFEHFDVDAKLGPQLKMLEAVVQDYPHTRPSYEAMMVLGKLYLDHGNPAVAASWFKKSTEDAPTALDKALAWSSVGYAYENTSKYKDAIDAFDHALAEGEGTIKGDVLMGKARSYQALHDTTQANTVYDQIISQLPGTDYAKNAQSFKARTQ